MSGIGTAGSAVGTLDPTPAPGAAPYTRRVLAQAGGELGILLRNAEQLLVAILLPAIVLIALVEAHSPGLGSGSRVDVATPGVLALAVMSSAFTGQAIQTGFDRRYGVLRLLGSTPLGRGGLLAAKALGVLGVLAIQVIVLGGIGVALGWRPDLAGLPAAVVLVAAGTAAFVALALLLAGLLRAEAVLAVANLVWVMLLAAGAVVVPARTMPSPLRELAAYLPSGALGAGLRAALQHGDLDVRALVVLIVWLAGSAALVARTFRWTS